MKFYARLTQEIQTLTATGSIGVERRRNSAGIPDTNQQNDEDQKSADGLKKPGFCA
jgi:hypothetical protein